MYNIEDTMKGSITLSCWFVEMTGVRSVVWEGYSGNNSAQHPPSSDGPDIAGLPSLRCCPVPPSSRSHHTHSARS